MGIMTKAKLLVDKHAPKALVVAGVIGIGATVYSAVKATPKALEIKKKLDEDVELPVFKEDPKEYITAWVRTYGIEYAKTYKYVGLCALATILCFISSNNLMVRKLSMSLLTNQILSDKSAAIEKAAENMLGPNKFKEFKENIGGELLKKSEETTQEIQPYQTEYGDYKCYDSVSGRYFYSDIGKVREAENEIIKRLPHEMLCSLNEFYDCLGIPRIKLGTYVGWDITECPLEVTYSSHLDKDGIPVLVLDYTVAITSNDPLGRIY